MLVIAAANIAANTTAAPDTGANAASRAALKNMPADMSQMFASLLADDDTAAAQPPANGVAPPTDAKPADGKTTVKPTDIDQALLAQLKTLQANDDSASVNSDAVPQTKRGKDSDKQPEAAAIPTATILQQLLAKAQTSGDTGKIGDKKATATAALPQDLQVSTANADSTKTDDKAIDDQIRTLGNAADNAKHQAAPAQTTIAKALQLNIDGVSGGQGQQTGGGHQQQRDQAPSNTNVQSDAPKLAEQAQPAATMTAQTSATPHANTQATMPATDAMAAQPAQVAQTSATPVTTAVHVMPQAEAVAMPNFGQLAVNITSKAKNGEKHFDIRLDPAELGRVDVKLSIDEAGKAQATLAAEKPQTLELLQRDRATLERSLRDAGLDLANNGLNFSLKGQERDTGSSGSAPRSRSLSAIAAVQSAADQPLIANYTPPADSRLDIRV